MRLFRVLHQRLRSLFRHDIVESDLQQELDFHRAALIEEHRRAGFSPREAAQAADRQLGRRTHFEDQCRDHRRVDLASDFLRDVSYALRQLRAAPVFTTVAILSLTLGIGGTTALFTVLHSVLLRALPYADADRIVITRSNESVPDLSDVLSWSQSFEAGGGVVMQPVDYTGGPEPIQLRQGMVTGGYFQTLGAQAAIGRTIGPSDDRPEALPVVVLGHSLWSTLFQADPAILGRQVTLAGRPYSVLGVMPQGFRSPRDPSELWTAVQVSSTVAAAFRGVHFLQTYLKVKSGVSIAQASAEMQVIDARLAAAHPAENKRRRTVLIPLLDGIAGNIRTLLWILFAAVCLVLVIACCNLANLLLVRGAIRERELAARAALGAGQARIVRMLLAESLTVGLLGGCAGVALAWALIRWLHVLEPANLPRLESVHLDTSVLLFALSIALLTGLASGLAPALLSARADLASVIRKGGRSVLPGAHQGLRAALLIGQISLAVLLLSGAGLLLRSLQHLLFVHPGFQPANLIAMRLDLPETRYEGLDAQRRYRQAVLNDVQSLPQVQAALISEAPFSGDSLHHDFTREGWQLAPGDEPNVYTRSIQGPYFETMRIPLRGGRTFSAQDNESAPLVGIVNEALVRAHFGGADPIGKRVGWARATQPLWITIVGVVADVKHFGLDIEDQPALYTPYAQSTFPWKRWSTLVVRTAADPYGLLPAIKRQVWKADPLIPVARVATLDEMMRTSLTQRRFTLSLLAAFAVLALVLAAIGIYGMLSYSVTQRSHEIGVRMALGARVADVIASVVRQGARFAAAGIALGLIAAWSFSNYLRFLLFGVQPQDPLTFGVVALVLAAVALIACWIPARRAARLDPMNALRQD